MSAPATTSAENPGSPAGTPVPEPAELRRHPLTVELETTGLWGWVDRQSDWVAGRLNPILVKEARQSLKSKQFLATFFLLLVCAWTWSVLGTFLRVPEVYYIPSGESMLVGYYLVLAIPLMGMVPLWAFRSLAAEIDEGTFEMLAITKLSSLRIVTGKLNSAILQMLIYFAAVVPGLAFSYLLRGINLPTIGMMLLVLFFSTVLLSTFGLMIAPLASQRAWQAMAMLMVVGVLVIAEFGVGAFCINALIYQDAGAYADAWGGLLIFVLISLSTAVLFVKAAAARIAPVTENRSTGLRWCMFAQQAIWVITMAGLTFYAEREYAGASNEILPLVLIVIGVYWVLMGSLMVAESSELSPRVQRDLPQTFAGRMVLFCFTPGPGTGYLFAICSGVTACLVIPIVAAILSETPRGNPQTPLYVVGLIMSGYLMSYLSLTRLGHLLLSRITGRSFVLSVSILGFFLFVGVVGPMLIDALFNGRLTDYGLLQSTNWAWTFGEIFYPGVDASIGILLFIVGGLLVAMNLLLFSNEVAYRHIATPERVQAETEASNPAPPADPPEEHPLGAL